MKYWFWLIWLYPLMVWSQPQTGEQTNDVVRKSFDPHYYKYLPVDKVDSLLTSLSTADSVVINSWRSQEVDFWQLGPVAEKPELLIIKTSYSTTNYLVYSRHEYCKYFGNSVRFDPWVITVEHK